MSIAVGVHTVAHTTSQGTSITTAGINTQATGSTFVIGLGWFNATTQSNPLSVNDNKSNGNYIQIGSTFINGGNQFGTYYFQNGAGGTGHTFSSTWSGNQDVITLLIVEITGGSATGILDQFPGVNDDAATPFTSLTTGTTAQANELALAFAYTFTNSGTETVTWGNSYTGLDAQGDANFLTMASAFLNLTSIGTTQSSCTSSGAGTNEVLTNIVTFKENIVIAPSIASVNYFKA